MKTIIFIIFTLPFLPLTASKKKPSTLDKKTLIECKKKEYDIKIIRKYLDLKADVNVNTTTTIISSIVGTNETPLHVIVANHTHPSRIEALKLLLDHNADPTIKDGDGYTPLHIMTENPSLKVTVTLLKGAFEIPASVPEMCKKYDKCRDVTFYYLLCLKRKKIKVPKYVNFMILYSVLRPEDENYIIKNIYQFITTSKDKSNGLFSSADVVLEDAIEMLVGLTSLPYNQLPELSPTLNFLSELKETKWESYNAMMEFIDKHDI